MKTSLAPGSTVVTDYLEQAGLDSVPRTSSASTWSATAARPASATPGRCPRRSPAAIDRERPGRLLGALGQPQLRGPHQPGRPGQLPRLAAAGASPTRSPGGWTSTCSSEPIGAAIRRRGPSTCRTSGRPPAEIRQTVAAGGRARTCSRSSYADVFSGDERWQPDRDRPRATATPGPTRPTSAAPRSSRAWTLEPAPVEPIRGRPRARGARRLGHHRPHLARPARSRRTARPAHWLIEHGVEPARLQLLRLAPRQPRGDDPRHLRQHPPAQPPGPSARAASRATCPTARR